MDDRIIQYFEGSLTGESRQQLMRDLLADEALWAEFVAATEIHGRLRWEFAGASLPRSQPWKRRLPPLLAAVAAVALIAGWLGLRPDSSPSSRSPGALATAGGSAWEQAPGRIVRTLDAEWQDGRKARTGEWLPPARHSLKSGSIQIALDGGGILDISGPCEFELVDAQHVVLVSGSLQARADEGTIGLVVSTPNGRIVDIGTEFVVSVGPDNSTDVQVIEGMVEAYPSHGDEAQPRLLEGNQRARIANDGRVKDLPTEDLPPMDLSSVQGAFTKSFHWSFDNSNHGRFPESGFPESGSDLALVARALQENFPPPQPCEGRFGGGVRFSGDGGFLESAYSGVSGNAPRTVAAWVRIPPDAPLGTAYGFTLWGSGGDYLESRKWQIGWNPQDQPAEWKQPLLPGAVRGALRTEFGPGWLVGTTDLRDNRWHHVVSIFTGGDSPDVSTQIRQYVNGRLDKVSAYQSARVDTAKGGKALPLIVGRHANVTEHLPGFYFTGFKGELDELYIFEGVLTPSQVWRLYSENKAPEPHEILPSLGPMDR